MQRKRLGRTGLKVTEICMGTMTFGNQASEATAHAILDRALETGVNFIDTADIYPIPGAVKTAGRTEEVIGRWLKGKRQRVVLATKRGGLRWAGAQRRGVVQPAHPRRHRREPPPAADGLCRSLPDPLARHSDPAGGDRAGAARFGVLGQSAIRRLLQLRGVAPLQGALDKRFPLALSRFESVQPQYNLLSRGIERELLPLCAEESVGVMTYSPLAGVS